MVGKSRPPSFVALVFQIETEARQLRLDHECANGEQVTMVVCHCKDMLQCDFGHQARGLAKPVFQIRWGNYGSARD